MFDSKVIVDIQCVLSSVNKFGKYHAVQYTLALLPAIFTAISNANYVFIADSIDYRCVIDECDAIHPSYEFPGWWPNSSANCWRPEVSVEAQNASCTAEMFSQTVEPCTKWVYQSQNTIVYEFGLACLEWKRTLVGTVHNVGGLISMVLLGYISDRWGRRVATIISAVGLSIGALKVFVSGAQPWGYVLFLVLEFLEATIGTAVYTLSFILLVELGGKERRVVSTAILGIMIALGEVCLSLCSWLLPYWRHLALVIYCPPLLFLLYCFCLKESLRWLLIKGKHGQAKADVVTVASMNGLQIPAHVMAALDAGEVVSDKIDEKSVEIFTIKMLFSSITLLKRLVICSWWWLAAALVYYGLMINSVSLPGSGHANFAIASAVSVPGDLLAMLLLQKWGRRWTLISGFFFCGVCCLVTGFIPTSMNWLSLTVYMLGKMAISTCFNASYVYTSELFPTSGRSTLVGICSMVGRVGSILAPMTPLLASTSEALPTLLFGFVSLTAAALTLLAPETRNTVLPDTIAQAERLEKC